MLMEARKSETGIQSLNPKPLRQPSCTQHMATRRQHHHGLRLLWVCLWSRCEGEGFGFRVGAVGLMETLRLLKTIIKCDSYHGNPAIFAWYYDYYCYSEAITMFFLRVSQQP